MSIRWDRHFLQLALDHARMSKDPSTKVGSIIVGSDRSIRAGGFNGFPRGIADTEERLQNRETKYKLVVHAELNAILTAAKIGTPLNDCTLYVSAISSDNLIWGGPPCIRCAMAIIQAGIVQVVGATRTYSGSRWSEDLGIVQSVEALFAEAGILYREVL